MTHGDWLRDLQVREAGHDGIRLLLGFVDYLGLHRRQCGGDAVHGLTHEQAHIGGHLVVSRARRVQLLADLADALGQTRLDVHVHVLELDGPLEVARLDVGLDRA